MKNIQNIVGRIVFFTWLSIVLAYCNCADNGPKSNYTQPYIPKFELGAEVCVKPGCTEAVIRNVPVYEGERYMVSYFDLEGEREMMAVYEHELKELVED